MNGLVNSWLQQTGIGLRSVTERAVLTMFELY